MDWMSIIMALIGVVGGGLATILFLPQTKRQKNIENESKQSEEWKKLYKESQDVVSTKQSKIDSLYGEIKKLMADSLEQQKENAKLSVENTRLKMLKCEVPACQKRTPPTGF